MIKCGSCGERHATVAQVRYCHDMWENTCDCGGLRHQGDHSRCWQLNAYDHDDLRSML
jgi:hypothetical protein